MELTMDLTTQIMIISVVINSNMMKKWCFHGSLAIIHCRREMLLCREITGNITTVIVYVFKIIISINKPKYNNDYLKVIFSSSSSLD